MSTTQLKSFHIDYTSSTQLSHLLLETDYLGRTPVRLRLFLSLVQAADPKYLCVEKPLKRIKDKWTVSLSDDQLYKAANDLWRLDIIRKYEGAYYIDPRLVLKGKVYKGRIVEHCKFYDQLPKWEE